MGSNNSTKQTGEVKSPYEQNWSLDDIRKRSDNWTLASDAGLLNYMEAFTMKLTKRAHEVSNEVSQLLHTTRLSDAKLQTAICSFMSISDVQFVENRVYDEDNQAEDENIKEKKVQAETEDDLQNTVKEIAHAGLKVIEECYDVLQVDPDDSDVESDEEIEPEFILEAKDPYVIRPLPHLIGSRAFIECDDVGVGELVDTEDEELGELSESEDEIEKAATVSDASSTEDDISSDEDAESVESANESSDAMMSSDSLSM